MSAAEFSPNDIAARVVADQAQRIRELEAEVKRLRDETVGLMLAQLAFPEMNPETVRFVQVPPDATSWVVHTPPYDMGEGTVMERIELQKYGVTIVIGYGPKTNVLAIREDTTVTKLSEAAK